jgi:hypothetical protein
MSPKHGAGLFGLASCFVLFRRAGDIVEKAGKLNARIMIVFFYLLLIFSWNISVIWAAADSCTVEAEGSAPIEISYQQAQRDALHDAQRNAVEKALGTIISSETIVENYILIKDKILTRVNGYVKKYKILSTSSQNQVYANKIRAEVEKMALADDIAALAQILPRMNYPSLAVLLQEQSLSARLDKTDLNLQAARQTIEKRLKQKGFTLVHIDALQAKNLMDGRQKSGGYTAQLLVNGTASVQDNGASPYSDRFHSYAATISADIYETATGQILASASTQAVVPHHSFAIGSQAALQKAAGEMADKLCRRIVKTWLDSCYNEHQVILVVNGTTFSDLPELTGKLSDLSGIAGVHQKTFSRGRAELVIKWQNCNTMRLAGIIDDLDFGGKHLEIVEVGGYILKAELKNNVY